MSDHKEHCSKDLTVDEFHFEHGKVTIHDKEFAAALKKDIDAAKAEAAKGGNPNVHMDAKIIHL